MNTTKNVAAGKTSTSNGIAKPKPGAPTTATPKPPTSTAAATKEEKPARDKKLPIAKRMERNVLRVAKRWAVISRKTSHWSPAIGEVMKKVDDTLHAAAAQFAALPDTFEAPRRAGGGERTGGKPLALETKVEITKKARTKYTDALTEEDMVGLIVKKILGSKVLCETPSKMRVIIPRGHVKAIDTSAA